jgi:hypothetical protein
VCTECFSVSSSSIPDDEELTKFYAAYNEKYSGGGRARGRDKRVIRYAERYLSVVRSVRTSGDLIDIGSSLNPFPNLAAEAGYNVTVADYVRPRNLAPKLEFISASLDDSEMHRTIGRTFDLVTAFAVIEHCRYPKIAANNLVSLSSQTGTIILMTPLVGTYLERYTAGSSGWYCPPEHLHLFSKEGMVRLFRSLGCDLLRFERFELDWMRLFARCGISAAEGTAGRLLHSLSERHWSRLRDQKVARSREMGLYVFSRHNA